MSLQAILLFLNSIMNIHLRVGVTGPLWYTEENTGTLFVKEL